MGQKMKIAGWVSVGVLAGALTTVSLQTVARGAMTPLPLEEIQQLSAVFGLVKTDYVEPVDDKKLITDAISGMVASLDPHSQYFDKKSFAEFREGTSGKFVGVGIEITQEDGLIKVVSPIEGSPAFRAGLKTNDLITKIDDTAVKGLSLGDAVKKMRGEPDTKVVLTIFRKDESRTFPVTITREEIKTQSVKARMIEPGYGWIRLSQFQERTVEDFVRKAEELYKADPKLKGLVLDLRNDPGGLLDAAVAISAAFLPPDVTVVTTNGQLAESKANFKASPEFYARRGGDPLKRLPAALKSVPLVVLVNEGSASASEIVAGALQDHKRATIMGSQTFGKGSVQTVRPLGPDTGIKLTTARYYTPSGKSIQARGIVPDVMLDETAEGNVFAALRMREADLEKHLNNGQTEEKKDEAREKAREEARKRLEEEAKKSVAERKLPEFGTDKDFQLAQALNQLRGKPVLVSKTQTERKEEKKETQCERRPAPALLPPHPARRSGHRRAGAHPGIPCAHHWRGRAGFTCCAVPGVCRGRASHAGGPRHGGSDQPAAPDRPHPGPRGPAQGGVGSAGRARHQPRGADHCHCTAGRCCPAGMPGPTGQRGARLLRQLRHAPGRQCGLRTPGQAAGGGRGDTLRRTDLRVRPAERAVTLLCLHLRPAGTVRGSGLLHHGRVCTAGRCRGRHAGSRSPQADIGRRALTRRTPVDAGRAPHGMEHPARSAQPRLRGVRPKVRHRHDNRLKVGLRLHPGGAITGTIRPQPHVK